jgi:3-mercaptopyruvate sulfurtransferase SseA
MGKKALEKKILLFFISAVLALGLLACASETQSQPEPQSPAPETPLEVERVSLEESKAAFDRGEATFVDVRGADSYAARHILGALSIPLEELEGRIGELDPNGWIITYCT